MARDLITQREVARRAECSYDQVRDYHTLSYIRGCPPRRGKKGKPGREEHRCPATETVRAARILSLSSHYRSGDDEAHFWLAVGGYQRISIDRDQIERWVRETLAAVNSDWERRVRAARADLIKDNPHKETAQERAYRDAVLVPMIERHQGTKRERQLKLGIGTALLGQQGVLLREVRSLGYLVDRNTGIDEEPVLRLVGWVDEQSEKRQRDGPTISVETFLEAFRLENLVHEQIPWTMMEGSCRSLLRMVEADAATRRGDLAASRARELLETMYRLRPLGAIATWMAVHRAWVAAGLDVTKGKPTSMAAP